MDFVATVASIQDFSKYSIFLNIYIKCLYLLINVGITVPCSGEGALGNS